MENLLASCTPLLGRLYRRFGFSRAASRTRCDRTEDGSYSLIHGDGRPCPRALAGSEPAQLPPRPPGTLNAALSDMLVTSYLAPMFVALRGVPRLRPPAAEVHGLLGAITYLAFFFLRFTRRATPSVCDGTCVPAAGGRCCSWGWALRDHWPQRLQAYYIRYSYRACCCSACRASPSCWRWSAAAASPAISNAFIVLCLPGAADRLAQHGGDAGRPARALAALAYVAHGRAAARCRMDLVAQLPALMRWW